VQGSLCFRNGVLYVGRHAKTAQVASYDLDGHRLETSFSFREEGGSSSASGLAVDDDHRVWVADEAAGALRAFTLFGIEVAKLQDEPARILDRAGRIGAPVDVCTHGADDELVVTVASGGTRRHAVQQLHPASGRTVSLRPLGDPGDRFRDVCGIARRGSHVFVAERRGERVQVFRDDEFHFAFGIHEARGRAACVAVAALEGGRVLVGLGGADSAVLLMDEAGRFIRAVSWSERAGGHVTELVDIEVAPGPDERSTRVAVLDLDGDRVQVLTLDGRCLGSFTDLPRT